LQRGLKGEAFALLFSDCHEGDSRRNATDDLRW
jgi:hypothetical protein